MILNALGITREIQHSPNRELDDSEILKSTGKKLSQMGWDVVFTSPEEVSEKQLVDARPDILFIMCEQEAILEQIRTTLPKGIPIVNSIHGILNTYRHRMVPLLKSNRIPMPKSELIPVSGPVHSFKGLWWVKRGDVHNTQSEDVSLAHDPGEIRQRLESFKHRGITQAVLQEHVNGDLIKFYGVGEPSRSSKNFWFRWFYHQGQDLKTYSFSTQMLEEITRNAARSLNLEVYGGDAIVDSKGGISLIDINAWPSFALFREEASSIIARHLSSKAVRPHLKVLS